jgi:hypothetical protein
VEDDDLQVFPNKEISKSEIDLVYVVSNFEYMGEDNFEEWLHSVACEADFQRMTERHCQHCHEVKGRIGEWRG